MQKPLVSIIVPVYNAEKYLPACLDSICNQTLRELEIIVVDDGSTDASGKIAEEYAGRDERIRVIHKRNGNPGATRNAGLGLVTGEYVGFVDSDDWIEPEMFHLLYEKAQEDDLDITITGVTVEYVRDNLRKNRLLNEYVNKVDISPLEAFLLLRERSLFAVVYNKLYRTELLMRCEIRFMEILPYEDLVFNLRAFMFVKRIGFLPDSPYHYMCRDNMGAANSFSSYHLQACEITNNTFRQFFRMYNWNDTEIETYLRSRRISDYSSYAISCYKKNSPITRKERILLLSDVRESRVLKQDLLLSPPSDLYTKLFYFFLFYTTPGITDSFYRLLFYLRYNLDPVYRKFRKFISK